MTETSSLAALAYQQEKEQRLLQEAKQLQPPEESVEVQGESKDLFGGQEITSTQQEGEWLVSQGYKTEKAGTYVSKEKGTYYYHKLGFEVDSPEKADEALQLVRTLTEKGFFPPGTVWSTVKREAGDPRTTLVAEMPALEVISADILALPQEERPEPWNRFTSNADMSKALGEGLSKIDYVFEASDRAETHIGTWVQSLGGEPGGDPTKGMNEVLGTAVNWGELGEYDNWAYDKRSNRFYPIDLEAIKGAVQNASELQSKLTALKA